MSLFNKDRLSQRQFKPPKLEPTRVNGQATSTKPPSNEILVFGVPAGTCFTIPADQAFIGELPNEIEKSGDFVQVTGIDDKKYNIPKGSLVLRPQNANFQMPGIHSDPRESYDRRKEERIKNLEREKERLNSLLSQEQARSETAEAQRNVLQGELRKWRDSYIAQANAAKRHEASYIHQWNLRTQAEENAKKEISDMAALVFELGSESEEISITEDSLLNEYRTLLSSISEVTNILSYRLHEESGPQKEHILASLSYGSTEADRLDLINTRLPAKFLHLLLGQVQSEFYTGLTASMVTVRSGQQQDVGDAFDLLENEIESLITSKQAKAEQGQKQKKTRDAEAAKLDAAVLTKSFYRWRSDTVRLLSLMNKQLPPVNETEVRTRITKTVCDKFLGDLVIANGDQPKNPAILFRDPSLGGMGRANAKLNNFCKKVDVCVGKAVSMFVRLRTCRANYVFKWPHGHKFDQSWMEISTMHELSERERWRYQEATLQVLECRHPALIKYGGDDGKRYSDSKVIEKAEVILNGLFPRPASKDDEITDNEQLENSSTQQADIASQGAKPEGGNKLEKPQKAEKSRWPLGLFSGGPSKLSTEEVQEIVMTVPEQSFKKLKGEWQSSARNIFSGISGKQVGAEGQAAFAGQRDGNLESDQSPIVRYG